MLTDRFLLAPVGTTGNNTGASATLGTDYKNLIVQFVVEAIGATPTVTFKVQSSVDGTNWVDAWYVTDTTDSGSSSTTTVTTVGVTRLYTTRPAPFWRVVTTLNTNVTYRCEAYASR